MKKVLKITGKVIGGIFGALLGFVVVCSVMILCWSGVQMSKGSVTEDMPETAEDFIPTVRFMVFTDSHINDLENKTERIENALEKSYELFENDEKYAGIDAIFSLGDFSSIGLEQDYDVYIEAINRHRREGIPIIDLLGNHEMKNKEADELFKEKFGYDPNGVYEINGFTFIAFSGTPALTEWTFNLSDIKWLKTELAKAEEKAGDKPVFVLQHPHNFGTVYGSTIWCGFQLNSVYAGHNKVVNFSGHSHFPMNDPKSINQSTYTSVGVGALCRFELDDHYIVGQHPEGYDTANQILFCEADNDGSVRIIEYDLNTDTVFNDYYIENVNDPDSYAYTYKNMKAHDTAPVFPENTKASAKTDDEGNWILSFNDAETYFEVHDYEIEIRDSDGNRVYKDSYVNDYYVIDETATARHNIGKDVLKSGETYTAEITAVSAYHKKSEAVTLTFTAE